MAATPGGDAFRYRRLNESDHHNPQRPYLGLVVRAPNGESHDLLGLLDSGADSTVFPVGLVAPLGYQFGAMQVDKVVGVGREMRTWLAKRPVMARIPGTPISAAFELWPRFADLPAATPILWGRRDLFAAFTVTFQEQQKRFFLERAPSSA